MGTPQQREGGSWRYQPTMPGGRRASIAIPRCSKRSAAKVARQVDEIIDCRAVGDSLPKQTREWLAQISDSLHESIASAGLVDPRVDPVLGSYIDELLGDHTVKESTRKRWNTARNRLVEYFGEKRLVGDIDQSDALEWHRWMLEEKGYAAGTVGRDVGLARQFMARAIEGGIIEANPFRNLSTVVRPDRGREFFIDGPMARLVAEQIEDVEFRAIFVLARWGGPAHPERNPRHDLVRREMGSESALCALTQD